MNLRTKAAIDRMGQDRRPLPTDDVLHACRGELEDALTRLDHEAVEQDHAHCLHHEEAERIIVEAVCDGYERGRHDAASDAWTDRTIMQAWTGWQWIGIAVLAWACFGAGVLWHWLHFR